MHRLQRKGSYFYVIDAFVASIIIISALLILVSRYVGQPPSTQAFYTGEDFLSSIESTQVRSYDSPVTRGWMANGTVKDPTRTLLQQLALFELPPDGQPDNPNTHELAALLASSVPRGVGMEIIVNSTQSVQAYITPPTQILISEENATNRLIAKRIVLLRQNPTDLYDPVIVEVRTWQ